MAVTSENLDRLHPARPRLQLVGDPRGPGRPSAS